MPKLELPISDDVPAGDELAFQVIGNDIDEESLKLLIDGAAVDAKQIEFTFDGDREFLYVKNLTDDDWYAGSQATLLWD